MAKKKKNKEVSLSLNTIILIGIFLVVVLLLRSNLNGTTEEELAPVTGGELPVESGAEEEEETSSGGSGGGSGGGSTEPECDWVLIGEVDYITKANGYVDWVETVPVGDYKFTWQVGDFLQNIQIIKNSASIERFTNQAEGEYLFEETSGSNEWGIAVENPHDVPASTNVKLFQWICEDDPLNWESSMFKDPHMEWGDEVQD